MNAPREGCPAWCTECRPVEDLPEIWQEDGTRHHRSVRRIFRVGAPAYTIGVQLHQITGDQAPDLVVGGVWVKLGDAESMAGLMRSLGREDIAAAVEELAALITGGAK